jgi:kinesin family protein 18/19
LTTEDKSLDVREDKNAGIVVAGITEVDAKSVNEVMALLKVY